MPGKLTLLLILLFLADNPMLRARQAPTADSSDQSLRTVLAGMDSLSLQQFQRRRALLDALIYSSGLDTNSRYLTITQNQSLLDLSRSLREDQSYKQAAPIDRDEIARRLGINYADGNQTLDFGSILRGLLNKAYRKLSGRPKRITDLPIPTPLQMDVLKVLWEKGRATGPEIYKSLPKETVITADMLWRELHRMASNGFLEEKIISPQNTMTIMTPVGGIPVEMSGKNRRNRVYAYTPKVDRETMLHYIDSRRYLISDSTASDGQRLVRSRDLQDLLYKMLISNKRAASDTSGTTQRE